MSFPRKSLRLKSLWILIVSKKEDLQHLKSYFLKRSYLLKLDLSPRKNSEDYILGLKISRPYKEDSIYKIYLYCLKYKLSINKILITNSYKNK